MPNTASPVERNSSSVAQKVEASQGFETLKQTDSDKAVVRMRDEVGTANADNRALIGRCQKAAAGRSEWDVQLEDSVSELDKDSPAYKYAHSDNAARNNVLKTVLSDCRSSDLTKQRSAGENLKQIMFLEALSGLAACDGKTDSRSQIERSYAINLLAGQSLCAQLSGSDNRAAAVLSRLEEKGDQSIHNTIAAAVKNKIAERESVTELARVQFERLLTGTGKEAAQAVENLAALHTMQLAEGNTKFTDLDAPCREILAEKNRLADADKIELADARPTPARPGRNASGTLVLPGLDAGSFSQFAVKDGKVLDQAGQAIGMVEDNGDVQIGNERKFNIASRDGAAFHGTGTDGNRLDLVADSSSNALTAVMASQDGREVFTITGGNMFDANGKMIGRVNSNGQIESSENGQFRGSQSLNVFRSGYNVLGEENGKSRNFVTSAAATNGFMLIKDTQTGKHVRHEVQMGMLIDSRSGQQVGWVNPPQESADGKLLGGSVVTLDKSGNYRDTALSASLDTVFNLQLTGVSGVEASSIEGIAQGDDKFFNVGEAKRLEIALKHQAENAIHQIDDSEKGFMGSFNLKWVSGMNAAEKGGLGKTAAASGLHVSDLEEVMKGDSASIANMQALKLRRDDAHDALYGKSDAKEAAPPTVEIPLLTSKEDVASVNGQLRMGHQVFTIKNGELFEKGNENAGVQGNLLPGYRVELGTAGNKSLVDLSKQNYVLMQFTSRSNQREAQLIGMGQGHMTGGLGYQEGGLIDVRSLSQNARSFENQARKGNQEYFANRPYVTGGLANWAMGDREALLKEMAGQIDRKVLMMNGSMQELFVNGFDTEKVSAKKFDSSVQLAQSLMHTIGAQSADTQNMARQGQQIQGQVNEAVVMAAITVATAGVVNPAFAAMAKAGHLAKVGASGAVALEIGACAGTGAVISASMRASDNSSTFNNLKAGAIEGAMMGSGGAGSKLLGKIDEAKAALQALRQGQKLSPAAAKALNGIGGKILNISAVAAPAAAPEAAAMVAKGTYHVGNAVFQSAGYSAAASVREGKSLSDGMNIDKIALSAAANLFGQYAGLKADGFMNSKAVLGKELQAALAQAGQKTLAGQMVANVFESMTSSGTEAIHIALQEQEKQNPLAGKDYLRALSQSLETMAMSGLTSTLLSASLKPVDMGLKSLIGNTEQNVHTTQTKAVLQEQRDHYLSGYERKFARAMNNNEVGVIGVIGDREGGHAAQAKYVADLLPQMAGQNPPLTHVVLDLPENMQASVSQFINGKATADELSRSTGLDANHPIYPLLVSARSVNAENGQSGKAALNLLLVGQEGQAHWPGFNPNQSNAHAAMRKIVALDDANQHYKALFIAGPETLNATVREIADWKASAGVTAESLEKTYFKAIDAPREFELAYAADLKKGRTAKDSRPDEVLKGGFNVADSLNRNALEVLAVSPKAAIEDVLAYLSKTDAGLAKQIVNERLRTGSDIRGHGVKGDLAVASAKDGLEATDVALGHLRLASEDFGQLNYRMAVHELVGHRGMDNWMENDGGRKSVLDVIRADYNDRFKGVLTDKSLLFDYHRAPQEIAAETIASTAVYKRLFDNVKSLEAAGQKVPQETKKAMQKLEQYVAVLNLVRSDVRPQDKALSAQYDKYYEMMDEYIRLTFGH